ncbi:hypothetical protein BH10PAT3_BH10PAT3_5380 [soil metagenome]
MKNNQDGIKTVEGLLILLLLLVIGFAGWFALRARDNTAKTQQSAVEATKDPVKQPAANTTEEDDKQGTITGTASYPGSGLPADEEVCAVSIADATKTYCDKIGARQPANTCQTTDTSCIPKPAETSFSVKVPAGEYYVYSTAEKEQSNKKAYWDEFARCGNQASCLESGHQAYITVTVAAGETITGIEPGDWY